MHKSPDLDVTKLILGGELNKKWASFLPNNFHQIRTTDVISTAQVIQLLV